MRKTTLEEFFEETDAKSPKRLRAGDRTWTSVIRLSSKDKLICENPSYHGDKIHILPGKYPDEIAGVEVFREGGGLNEDIESVPIYVEIERNETGTYLSRVLEAENWPSPSENDDTSIFETERKESIEWRGSPQKSGSAGSDKRQELLSEDNIRGSKNDLIK